MKLETLEYDQWDNNPYKPKWAEDAILAFLKKRYFKKPYDRFMWWRSYTAKKKPLPNKASFVDKCKNGDYDYGPFTYEIELVKHKLRPIYQKMCIEQQDHGRFLSTHSIDKARIKRLYEDLQKDETRKLDEVTRHIMKEFGLSRIEAEDELINCEGETMLQVYRCIQKKYKNKIK